MRGASLPPRRAGFLWAMVGLLLCGALALYAAKKYGPAAAGGALVVIAAVGLLLADGQRAVLVLLLTAGLAEADPTWGIAFPAKLYNHVPSPFEALEAVVLLSVLLYLAHRRFPLRLHRPLPALGGLLLSALVFGTLVGLEAGVTKRSSYVSIFQSVSPLLVVPFLVVNVVRTRSALRTAILVVLGLAGVKAFLGLFVVFSGLAPVNVGIGRITYYNPTANMITALFLLIVLAARLAGVRLARWVWLLSPVVFACLLLSYRRSFWLGTALAAILLLAPASGHVGRRLLVPGILVLGLVVYLAIGTGVTGDLQGSIANRVTSLNVGSLERNSQDRYRIDERKNVWAAIKSAPVSGIGLGTPWTTRYALGIEFPDGHLYSHFAALWWWMKMGLLGLGSYVLLLGSVLVLGVRVWRGHPDPVVRAFGLAAGAFSVGMAVVELTATLIGPDERASLAWGALLGLLAVASSQIGLRDSAVGDDMLV